MKTSQEQFNAYHLWASWIAQAMQEKDIDTQALMKAKSVSVPVTQQIVENTILKPIMQAMFDINSSTKLKPAQTGELYDVVNRHLVEHFNISVPFPHDSEDER